MVSRAMRATRARAAAEDRLAARTLRLSSIAAALEPRRRGPANDYDRSVMDQARALAAAKTPAELAAIVGEHGGDASATYAAAFGHLAVITRQLLGMVDDMAGE